jgi:hypothetical protein
MARTVSTAGVSGRPPRSSRTARPVSISAPAPPPAPTTPGFHRSAGATATSARPAAAAAASRIARTSRAGVRDPWPTRYRLRMRTRSADAAGLLGAAGPAGTGATP